MSLRTRTMTIALGMLAIAGGTRADASDFLISSGESVQERLGHGDDQLADGEYFDRYTFTAKAGDQVIIEMHSNDVDAYLMLVLPDGDDSTQNNDFGRSTNARLALTLPQSGEYVIYATSLRGFEKGNYTLSILNGRRPGQTFDSSSSSTSSELYGVFVGMSDYPGDHNDLPYCADDATELYRTLVENAGLRPENAIVLRDEDATGFALRQAIDQIASYMGPNDTFVFFFSGHGAQVATSASDRFGADRHDGLDETIELYDGPVLDHELAAMLDAIDDGTSMIVLDSCFSGGFARDVISTPGRLGVFSSQEDMVSAVAAEYKDGGYLSHFFRLAFEDGRADVNGDDMLTAFEMTDYLHEQFRDHVMISEMPSDAMLGSGAEPMHQHLVTDRGGVPTLEILFALD